jgi:chromosome segregation ATPase
MSHCSFKNIFLVATLFSIAACQSTGSRMNTADCDPSKGGFISGMQGLSSGCYDRRVTQKETKLSQARSLTEELNRENKNLGRKKTATSAKLSALRHKVQKIQKSNAHLAASLAKMKSKNAADTATKAALQKRLENLNASLAKAKHSGNEAALAKRVAELQKERDQLADEISTAMVGS